MFSDWDETWCWYWCFGAAVVGGCCEAGGQNSESRAEGIPVCKASGGAKLLVTIV